MLRNILVLVGIIAYVTIDLGGVDAIVDLRRSRINNVKENERTGIETTPNPGGAEGIIEETTHGFGTHTSNSYSSYSKEEKRSEVVLHARKEDAREYMPTDDESIFGDSDILTKNVHSNDFSDRDTFNMNYQSKNFNDMFPSKSFEHPVMFSAQSFDESNSIKPSKGTRSYYSYSYKTPKGVHHDVYDFTQSSPKSQKVMTIHKSIYTHSEKRPSSGKWYRPKRKSKIDQPKRGGYEPGHEPQGQYKSTKAPSVDDHITYPDREYDAIVSVSKPKNAAGFQQERRPSGADSYHNSHFSATGESRNTYGGTGDEMKGNKGDFSYDQDWLPKGQHTYPYKTLSNLPIRGEETIQSTQMLLENDHNMDEPMNFPISLSHMYDGNVKDHSLEYARMVQPPEIYSNSEVSTDIDLIAVEAPSFEQKSLYSIDQVPPPKYSGNFETDLRQTVSSFKTLHPMKSEDSLYSTEMAHNIEPKSSPIAGNVANQYHRNKQALSKMRQEIIPTKVPYKYIPYWPDRHQNVLENQPFKEQYGPLYQPKSQVDRYQRSEPIIEKTIEIKYQRSKPTYEKSTEQSGEIKEKCPSVPVDFCGGRVGGHYSHPSDRNCFVHCNVWGRPFTTRCPPGTSWARHHDQQSPSDVNLCI